MTRRLLIPYLLFLPILSACEDPAPPDPPVLRVDVSTEGAAADLDADGYALSIDSDSIRYIAPNGSATISDLEPGERIVLIGGVESNCAHTGANPQFVTLQYGQTAEVAFTLACVPRRGNLEVAITTTGDSADSDGYLLEILSYANGGPDVLFSGAVAANDALSLENVVAGPGEARLSGVASNCRVTGQNPRATEVAHGRTFWVGFDVACLAPLEIEVTVGTTGELTPGGYTIVAIGEADWKSIQAPANGTVRITGLEPGNYGIHLQDAPPSCDAVVHHQTAAGVLGGTVQLDFAVDCAAPREFAFVSAADGDPEIYLALDDGSGLTRLTENTAADEHPAWSPDGTRIAFTSDRNGDREIYVMNADGSDVIRLTEQPGPDHRPAWSPDGATILFVSERDGGDAEIYAMAPDGTDVTRITDFAGVDADPAWSPDGARIAFTRDDVLHVMNADGTGAEPLTTADPYYIRVESGPAWSPDGTRLAYAVVWCGGYYYYPEDCGPSEIAYVEMAGASAVAGDAAPAGLDVGDPGARDPAWYPDGRKITYTFEGTCDGPAECGTSVRLLRPEVETLTLVERFASSPAWRRSP